MENIGLISIVLCWAGLIYLIKKWPGNSTMTFSQHAAQEKSAIIYYLVLWLVVLPPFYWFMIEPFSTELGLSLVFKIIITLGFLGMLGAAIVPELPGWKFKVHRMFAFSMATLLIPALALIAVSPNINQFPKIITFASLAFMLWSAINVWFNTAINHKVMEHPYMLPLQAAYVASFHLSVLVAYYF